MVWKDRWAVKTGNLLTGVVCKVGCSVNMDAWPIKVGKLFRGVASKEVCCVKMGGL